MTVKPLCGDLDILKSQRQGEEPKAKAKLPEPQTHTGGSHSLPIPDKEQHPHGVVMSEPTAFEHEHYEKLVGRQITAILWDDFEGQPLPVLVLSGTDREGHAAVVSVLADPEGNGPGHLEHQL